LPAILSNACYSLYYRPFYYRPIHFMQFCIQRKKVILRQHFKVIDCVLFQHDYIKNVYISLIWAFYLSILSVIYRFLESAEMYAQTQNSFEEVALKFIRLEDKDALRKLLHKKLESLRPQVSCSLSL
jgi:hypothetical protein